MIFHITVNILAIIGLVAITICTLIILGDRAADKGWNPFK